MSPIASLPGDILLDIAGYLNSLADTLHLSLASRHIFTSLCPALYAQLHLNTAAQCATTLSMLCRQPDIARHVQKLYIRVTGQDIADNYTISAAVRKAASKLDALNTFVWDADEIPSYDDMWFALRISCPRLRTIATSYGTVVPHSHSHLFDFNNLVGFSLALKEGFSADEDDIEEHRDAILPNRRLWDMLIRRSPDLQELHITTSLNLSPTMYSLRDRSPLYRARWPRLLAFSLTLSPNTMNGSQFLRNFLEAHPNLQSLRTSTPHPIPTVPDLTHFAGPLLAIPASAYSSLCSLTLTSPLLAGMGLPNMKQLKLLRVAFTFHSPYESGSVLRSLISSCPGLMHLEIVCERRPSFLIQSVSSLLTSLPRLRTVRFALVRAPKERSLAECAAHMARTNPRLEGFTITFVPGAVRLEDTLLPTPFDLSDPYTSIMCAPHHPYIESGAYTLNMDHHGLPVSLVCVERRPRLPIRILAGLGNPPSLMNSLPLGFQPSGRSSNQIKRYTLPLRPRRSPMKWGVVLERSAAGEEMRVLLVLMMLGGVAVVSFFI
ncbi:hypothetical protein BJ138DRAFT_1146034 [Hygrophoropsis aurantiaca]|uniref:Uncharacterized protein n=1 Tax=Hygrophoropsis aurantiaca TaxID=72124 RepID=A0ACB8AKL3_9AGAM|nr:hypothetical protein BJ138DRAFT_1146034 [Hygrophoropsis aurantiaca]